MLDKYVPRSGETDSKEEILKKLKGLLLVPLVILSVPMAPLLFCLDGFCGSAPLLAGQPAVVTVGISQPLDGLSGPPVLKAPEGMSVESPPVRVFSQHEVSWRVRPERPVSGKLELVVGGRTVEKSVEAVAGGLDRSVVPFRERAVSGVGGPLVDLVYWVLSGRRGAEPDGSLTILLKGMVKEPMFPDARSRTAMRNFVAPAWRGTVFRYVSPVFRRFW